MRATYEIRDNDYHYSDDKDGNVNLWCSPHLHYHMELVYMIEGEVLCGVDSKTYVLKKGDFLAVFPNKVHRFERITTNHKYKLYIINPDMCQELTEKFLDFTPECPVIEHADENYRIKSVLECMSSLDENEEYYNIKLHGYITSLFCEILSNLKLIGEKRIDDTNSVKIIVDFCAKNFKRELSLSLLERELYLSKYYISHIFSGKFGVNFNDYLNSLRVSYACRMLITTDQSVTKISELAGFNTLRTFNRAFFKQMGMSPSEYRKSHISLPYEETAASVIEN